MNRLRLHGSKGILLNLEFISQKNLDQTGPMNPTNGTILIIISKSKSTHPNYNLQKNNLQFSIGVNHNIYAAHLPSG